MPQAASMQPPPLEFQPPPPGTAPDDRSARPRVGNGYPVHYRVHHEASFSRLQLATRLIAFLALGVIGVSFGTVFGFLYLALPAFASARMAGQRSPTEYLRADAPRILRGLHWFAAVSAWAGLITEYLPGRSPKETIEFEVEALSSQSPRSALWRVITGLPSALVLALLGFIGVFVWLWAALTVLLSQRVGDGAFHYLVGLQRWSLRLLVYQAALVDEYPPFSFAEPTPPHWMPSAHSH